MLVRPCTVAFSSFPNFLVTQEIATVQLAQRGSFLTPQSLLWTADYLVGCWAQEEQRHKRAYFANLILPSIVSCKMNQTFYSKRLPDGFAQFLKCFKMDCFNKPKWGCLRPKGNVVGVILRDGSGCKPLNSAFAIWDGLRKEVWGHLSCMLHSSVWEELRGMQGLWCNVRTQPLKDSWGGLGWRKRLDCFKRWWHTSRI